MPTPTLPTLGATTVHRKWLFEVNTGTTGAPTWTAIGGINNSQFSPDAAVLQDDSDMGSGGSGSQTKTAGNASASLTLMRKVGSDGVSYDVGQEFLRSKGIGQYGPANSVQLRISEYSPGGGPRVEAYMGSFAVGWDPQAGDHTALESVVVTLTGQGKCAPISHPYSLTAVVPTVTSIDKPLATAGGTVARISGSSFTGTTSVSVAGATLAAGTYTVDNDAQITFSAPAHAAGSGLPVIVTNGTGASATANIATYQ
jgi:hypothetical protein